MNIRQSNPACRRMPLVVAIVAALTWLPAGQALAQDNPAVRSGAETSDELDTVVVTANKREEDILEVPSSISVINEEQIENLHATQLSDFQATVPGLYINSDGSPGQVGVTLRGISPLSSSATVGTYVDEIPVGSSGLYQAAQVFMLDLLPYDISRIEVLRGPQGTLYGASTMGGLLKYVTVEPDLVNYDFRVGGGLSSVENGDSLGWNYRLGANLPLIQDSLALRFSYAQNEIPGYIDNEVNGDEAINGGKQTSIRANLLWQTDNVSFDLLAMRQTIDSENNAQVALDPLTYEPLYGDLVNSVYVNEPFKKDVDLYAATIDWDLGWGNFISATGYTDMTTRNRQDTTLLYGEFTQVLGLEDPGSSYFDTDFDFDKFTQEFRLASKDDGPFDWMTGFFYTKEEGTQSQDLKLNQLDGMPLPPPFDEVAGTLAILEIPSTYKETAFFANGGYRFNDLFKLSAGIRYAENDQDFSQNVTAGLLLPIGETPNSSSEGVFTWSLSPQFFLNDDNMLYARIATGYQPGGPNVIVTGLPPAVDSSTLTSYEMGLKSQLADNRVILELTGFYIDWTDIQVASVVDGISGLVNAGKATSQGIEFSSVFKVSERFDLGLNGAYTDAVLDDDYPSILIPDGAGPDTLVEIISGQAGDRLPYVPKWSWSATGDYYFPVGNGWTGHLGGALRYIGDRDSGTTDTQNIYDTATAPPTLLVSDVTDPLTLDSYWALDLNAYFANENWTLRAYVKNATDERAYQSISDITSAVTGVTNKLIAAPIQPRTFGFEVDYRF
ncbi:TonB-dependent receptor [Dokdonella sp.]|uniref:TonB-dependent receptor n=1 Tax=Dokdonella sp. TaxID=2291710 RepID=UPI00352924C1